jgi:hypothetical protein
MNRTGTRALEFPRDRFDGKILSRVWVEAPRTSS